jgi:hypothetical protein
MPDSTIRRGAKMKTRARVILAVVSTLGLLLLAPPVRGQATGEKPLLSDAIRTELDANGPAAAERHFQEILRRNPPDHTLDVEGLAILGSEYMKKGDMAAAQAVFRMVAVLQRRSYDAASGAARRPPGAPIPSAGRPATDAVPSPVGAPHAESSPASADAGPAQDDLERFTGIYGDPAQQGPTPRNIAISLTCDGRLAFGATWGDVAPWVMKRLSELEFEQAFLGQYDPEPIRVAFELDGSGTPIALTHNLGKRFRMPARLARLGALPDQFSPADCEG